MIWRLLRRLTDDGLGGIVATWATMTVFLPQLRLPWWAPLTLLAAAAAVIAYALAATRRPPGGYSDATGRNDAT